MSVEMLIGIEKIGDFEIKHVNLLQLQTHGYIETNHQENTITFKMQDGPTGEVGINGCQIDTIIEAAKIMLEGLDKRLPCDENKYAIDALIESLNCLKARKKNREIRGVEGTNQA